MERNEYLANLALATKDTPKWQEPSRSNRAWLAEQSHKRADRWILFGFIVFVGLLFGKWFA